MPEMPAATALLRRYAGSPFALDVLTALSCFALMVLDVPGLAAADNSLSGFTATVVLAAGSAALLLRRRVPWVTYFVALVLLAWLHELTLIQFALYSLGRFRGRWAGIAGTVVYVALAYALFTTPGWPDHRGDTLSSFLSLVVPIGVLASSVGIAAYRQDLVRELEAQRAETVALQAVQEERQSVARDVHDLVGRELTMLTVRSEVLAVRSRGTDHEADFEELSETARRAHLLLNEIIVRRADERRGATPGLDGLPALAAQSGRAGSPVRLTVTEEARTLSPLRQAAFHRVVQECLTNAAKHAPGEQVTVTVTATRAEISNALPASAPSRAPVSTGTGMLSMEERMSSVGGTLSAGREDGTYRVVARIPS
ncbi:sensor histidine kinase [Streptomyces sp. NBC_01465]|uniref:sensor histidine kinase n=1 Tax=Streptomyces sp. NBC_01465 TaxID=2903878 RepID=UPI002E30B9FC|nr:histidine kinase [Streptomyces sp. NBC_01465]